MPTSSLWWMLRNQPPRWLRVVNAVIAILLVAFIPTAVFTMPSPVGLVSPPGAMYFPAVMVLGVMNGTAMAWADGNQP